MKINYEETKRVERSRIEDRGSRIENRFMLDDAIFYLPPSIFDLRGWFSEETIYGKDR